ncbi:hypothetical protein A1332_11965 [Methylomonas methanica]|uniref:Uncharacterized protein n=1 Tax=Methylomonas methanica TaxID=421 RepID=A0A177MLV4_METMH|nr:hypothetical protein A1332_11965 [Methylomonas methanica]
MRSTRRAKNKDVFRETDIKISCCVSDTKHESLLTAWVQKPCPPYTAGGCAHNDNHHRRLPLARPVNGFVGR